jgi:hypothetical protein
MEPTIRDNLGPQPKGANPALPYAKTYVWMRTIVGLIGILLPIAFIAGEAYLLRGGVHVRGSLSAYYHSSMRDLFVAGLCIVGFLLITYMWGQRATTDFWFSLLAGVAVIGVVVFPTWRPAGRPRCGARPEPIGCSPTQQQFGEARTAAIHFICALVFILSLAVIAYVFAWREKSRNDNRSMSAVQAACASTILVAVGWAAVGELNHLTVWELTPLYIAEVVSVWAFGISWLLTGRQLLNGLAPAPVPAPA